MTEFKYDISAHERWVADAHLKLQKFVVAFVAPISVIIFLIVALIDRCWQTTVLFIGFVVTAASWFFCLHWTRTGRLARSITGVIISILFIVALSLFLIRGLAPTSIIAALAVVIYASMFSERFLFLAAGMTLAAFVGSEIVRYYELYPMKVFSPFMRLWFEIGFAVLLIPVVVIFLRGGRKINEGLLEATRKVNDELKSVIGIAGDVGRVLEDVVQQIKDISGAFAGQAGEQTEAIREVSRSMLHLREIASKTSSSAVETQTNSAELREKAILGSKQLKGIEREFDQILKSTMSAQEEFSGLAERAERIEDVLSANREIAAQIKILAINAGIQAAKAGDWGSGFRVVAKELKAMIQRTDDSLDQSRSLLEDIRRRAHQSAEMIANSINLLNQQFYELNATGDLIGDITDSFGKTATRFDSISKSALDQQLRLDEISNGISHIDTAAEELSTATEILLESVDRIVESNDQLKDVLGAG